MWIYTLKNHKNDKRTELSFLFFLFFCAFVLPHLRNGLTAASAQLFYENFYLQFWISINLFFIYGSINKKKLWQF